jgi:O-antigen ligase
MKKTAANLGQRYAIAYLALFTLILGDTLFAEGYLSVTPAWFVWLSVAGICLLGSIYFLLKSDWLRVLKQIPIELILLIALMIGNAPWSAYATDTVTSFGIQIGVTLLALFFIASFTWREIHQIFANAVRVIIFGSFLIELVASSFKGSLALLVPASEVSLREALSKSGHLFDGGRIQGLLGNANFTAAWALIGVITFAIEIAIRKERRWLAVASLVASISMIAIAQSAGVIFASIAVLVSAVVSLIAEGKDRETRHRYYRVAWALAGAATFLVLVFRRPVFEFLGKSPDMTHRSDIWRKVLSLISQRPLEGWGFTGVWVPGARPLDGLIVINGETYYQAHNAYLDMWLQLGAVGLILFVILLTRTFVKTWQLGVHHSNPLYLWPLLLLVTQLMRGITESRLLIQSAMFMLIIFAVKVYDPENQLEESSDKTKIKQLDKLRKKPS